MHLIEHTFSPTRLLLVWQAPEGNGRDSVPCVIGELRNQDGAVSFRCLTDNDDFHRAVSLGFICYPAFRKLHAEAYTGGTMDSFLRRLPSRSRGDFAQFFERWRLPATASTLSDFALLAYAGAKLPSDGFSVVWLLDEVAPLDEVLPEVAGFRSQNIDLSTVTVDAPVRFVLEPENAYDKKAIRMAVGPRQIGYVRRTQRDAVANWLVYYHIEAFVVRFNGTPERPIIYVFCRLTKRHLLTLPRTAAE